MATNVGFVLSFKGQGGYIPLYPKTTIDQVQDWAMSEILGDYQIVLNANSWSNNIQTVGLNGVTSDSYLVCNKVLSGDTQAMIEQDDAYSLLLTVQSLNNAIRFTCSETPTTNITVQINWVR